MHECPICGQACDCDGEDIWNEDAQTIINCTHYIEFGCDDPEDEEDDMYYDLNP